MSLWFSSWTDADKYLLVTDSDNPVPFNSRLVELPISPDCEVADYFGLLYGEEAEKEFEAGKTETGNPVRDTFYFYSEYLNNQYPHFKSNGWYDGYGLLYPIIVEDGQIVYFDVEWR